MIRTNRFFLLFFGLSWLPAAAQSPAELMQVVREHNRELQALHREYEAALERAPQVSQLPNPEVGVGLFPAPVETRLGAQQARLSVGQLFPWFGTLEARKDRAHTEARSLYERIAATELDLAYRLRTAYYRLYENRASRAIIERRLLLLYSLRRLALSRVESGQGSTAAVLRLDRRILEREQALLILDHEGAKPLADLNELLFRSPDSPGAGPDTVAFAELPFAKDTLLSRLRAFHPALRMYQWQQQAAEQAIAINELERRPSFSLGLDYIAVAERTDAVLLNNGRDILQLRAGVSVPLYRERYDAREREERLRIQALEDRQAATENAMVAAVERAYADHASARLQYDLYRRQRQTTEAIIQVLQAEYRTAEGRLEELLRLEDELVEYDLQLLKATVLSQLARAGIERYLAP
jgi:outer membrane protein TolC